MMVNGRGSMVDGRWSMGERCHAGVISPTRLSRGFRGPLADSGEHRLHRRREEDTEGRMNVEHRTSNFQLRTGKAENHGGTEDTEGAGRNG